MDVKHVVHLEKYLNLHKGDPERSTTADHEAGRLVSKILIKPPHNAGSSFKVEDGDASKAVGFTTLKLKSHRTREREAERK